MRTFFSSIWLLLILSLSAPIAAHPGAHTHDPKDKKVADKSWTLVIHGGAGSMTRGKLAPEQDSAARAGLTKALEAGSAVLNKGGSAMDAVSAAIMVLEDDEHFNAGRGAVFTYKGVNELDASIMDGKTLGAGAVTGARYTKNPILLARAVMEKSPHVMLSREGADEFSREQGLEQVNPDYFATPERWRQLEELKAKKLGWYDVDLKYGTVGAVAVDSAGNVALERQQAGSPASDGAALATARLSVPAIMPTTAPAGFRRPVQGSFSFVLALPMKSAHGCGCWAKMQKRHRMMSSRNWDCWAAPAVSL